MTINLEEIKHLEELARINLSDQERKLYQEQLSSILDYVDKLQEVNVDKVEPTNQATDLKNVWREDEVVGASKMEKDTIINNAPEKSNKLFKVKSVFDK
jgi:aspartyl-tRNA(Asn)/glutamyl-tRNA(Gln) amidotransferase subunit C